MTPDIPLLADRTAERAQLIEETREMDGPGWEAQHRPGSFGCHELLDRTQLAADFVERYVVNHPACVLDPEWHRLAVKAADALHELYQRVGDGHLQSS